MYKDGFVVVLLDGTVSLAVKAFVAIGEVAAILIPCLVIRDQRPAFLTSAITVIPASLTQYDAFISFAVLTPDSGSATITLGRQCVVAVIAQECPVKHVAILGTDWPLALTAEILFVHNWFLLHYYDGFVNQYDNISTKN